MKDQAAAFFFKLALGFLLTAVFSLIFTIGVGDIYGHGKPAADYILKYILPIILAIFFFIFRSYFDKPVHKRVPQGEGGAGNDINPYLVLLSVLAILWAAPMVIIYWRLNPANIKKAIQVTSLILGLCTGIIYYWARKEDFKTTAEKISFFMGIITGPPTIVEFLL